MMFIFVSVQKKMIEICRFLLRNIYNWRFERTITHFEGVYHACKWVEIFNPEKGNIKIKCLLI